MRAAASMEAERADVLVCLRLTDPLLMPDNITGACTLCGAALQMRPHVPVRPPKLCIPCAVGPDLLARLRSRAP